MIVGGDSIVAWDLHQRLIRLLESGGLDRNELRSEFERIYHILEADYPWADAVRLQRWLSLLLTRSWLNPRVIVGRETAMRVFGKRSLSGQAPAGAEVAYDRLYPIYDIHLDLHKPVERPPELQTMEWDITGNEGQAWQQGAKADDWNHYPHSIHGLPLIGERSSFVRPEWEWPHEKRCRGLILGSPIDSGEKAFNSRFELTYDMYVKGKGQDQDQLIILNDENQLVGPTYRWAAINAEFARALGWHPSTSVPFQWLDSAGNVMVESIYWKNGWIWIEPPRFESLGEGWFVSASSDAVEAIRGLAPGAEIHLWVERQSHGEQQYKKNWHLSRPLCAILAASL